MAKLTPFAYQSGDSILFQLDVRCKLLCTCLVSIAVAKAGFIHLMIITVILFCFLSICGFKLPALARELGYFFILLLFILAARALVTPGTPLITVDAMGMVITREGIWDGVMVCWRFLTIMIMGILFSSTTNPSSLKGAVEWLLKPIPFVPEKRAGVMVSLFVRFLPLILQKTEEVSDAQKSRCVHLQKNPIKRIIRMGVPVLRKVFTSADRLAIAMESRCYSEDRTEQEFIVSGSELYFYLSAVLLTGFIFLV